VCETREVSEEVRSDGSGEIRILVVVEGMGNSTAMDEIAFQVEIAIIYGLLAGEHHPLF
jgi:hypothetical protein